MFQINVEEGGGEIPVEGQGDRTHGQYNFCC